MRIPRQQLAAAAMVVMLVAGAFLVVMKPIFRGGGSPNATATSSPTAGTADRKLSARVPDLSARPLVPDQPSSQNPVTAAASIAPSTVRPGEIVELAVVVRIAPGWHIYSTGESGGPAEPTTLELTLPAGI